LTVKPFKVFIRRINCPHAYNMHSSSYSAKFIL
jgi:hypothetical protein